MRKQPFDDEGVPFDEVPQVPFEKVVVAPTGLKPMVIAAICTAGIIALAVAVYFIAR